MRHRLAVTREHAARGYLGRPEIPDMFHSPVVDELLAEDGVAHLGDSDRLSLPDGETHAFSLAIQVHSIYGVMPARLYDDDPTAGRRAGTELRPADVEFPRADEDLIRRHVRHVATHSFSSSLINAQGLGHTYTSSAGMQVTREKKGH